MTSTRPLNVMIIEDEALLALDLELVIQEAGHRIVGSAMSSAEAQAMIAGCAPDLAFVDVHLADGPTGVEVARALSAAGVPTVVFMTANAKRLPEDYAGAVGVIAKPYTRNGLLAAIDYLEGWVRDPPSSGARPAGFTLSPLLEADPPKAG